ncbi:GLPGLI family protein [Terrimonas sp. NA20]|uniref:GLPGLI family protein n=1 Tax=Terrimonas ginsenosidimutans TaxID=2908004 RepID=A0ABS9KQE1_9BACT|nr:GLPGLI family protein [Terrimonas ginsenosidimutans]MCG2614519.1 GLPGLI family protein [Terrimonas ginsenosidimutans]
MKHIISALCCCLLICMHSSAQYEKKVDFNYVVSYSYEFQPDSTDPGFRLKETMLLLIGKDFSQFISEDLFRDDSILAALREEAERTQSMPRRPPRPQGSASDRQRAKIAYKIFKEFSVGQYTMSAAFGLHHAEHVSPIDQLNWQLVQEEKQIAGFTCKKATTSFSGRKYTAWYTTEIPISDGPHKFTGLPGLILSLSDTAGHHMFTAINVEKKSKSAQLHKRSGPLFHLFATKEEFIAYGKEMKADPAKMYEQPYMQVPEELLQLQVEKIKKSVAKNNNPIEL